ncbi:MAG: hypothetical protein V2I43_16930 [Parvularcula sp.]|nr:hypothetical protein [Parvularcula sp.]
MKKIVVGLSALAMTMGMGHAAQVVTDPAVAGTFIDFLASGPGAHGVELRGGDGAGAAQWEAGLGTQTSASGTFSEARRVDWSLVDAFRFAVDGSGNAVLELLGAGTSPLHTLNWSGLSVGNALMFTTKREADITITSVDGMAANTALDGTNWENAVFAGQGLTDGFEVTGLLRVLNGGNAANGIMIKTGNVVGADIGEVPVPAAGLLFGGALLAGAARRLKAKRTA